jgi:O-antigen/teichoic acid export membrane protein
MARDHASNPGSVRPWYYTSTRIIIMISLPIAVGGALISNDIVNIFGPEYLPASIALAILLWDLPFILYNAFCGRIANAVQNEKQAARIFFSVGVMNVALNFALVPTFGMIGACFATVLTDMFGSGLCYGLYRKQMGAGLQFKRILRILLAVIVMSIVVILLRDLNVILLIFVAGTVYAGLIILLGGLSRDEYGRVTGLLVSRLPNRLRSVFSA